MHQDKEGEIDKKMQIFLEISPVQKEVLLSQTLQDHAYE